MTSMMRIKAQAGSCGTAGQKVVSALVFIGLSVSGLINVWLEAPDSAALPGVALESEALLVVERSLAFFAAWMLVLITAAHAVEGRLPIEISGSGVRFADAPMTENMTRTTNATIVRMETELAACRDEQNDLRRLLTNSLRKGTL
jgi:hypothetical protein